MRLITLTNRYYLLLFLVVSGIGALVFYGILKFAVYNHIDEMLVNRKNEIVHHFHQNQGQITPLTEVYGRFTITPLANENHADQQFRDTLIYEPTDQEYDEYRKIETTFNYQGKKYGLTAIQPHLEGGEMVFTISLSMGSIFFLMAITFFVSGKWLSQKLWKPFYDTLNALQSFELERSKPLKLPREKIREFNALNRNVEDLSHRIIQTHLEQKKFTENAAHELQTPLANIQSKLQNFLQDENLTESQANQVHELMLSVQRLYKLNRSLLFLTRLDNKQFEEKQQVYLRQILEEVLHYFDETASQNTINVHKDIHTEVTVHADPSLVRVLITNLLKNAFIHNKPNGTVKIQLFTECLCIGNTSDLPAIPKDKIFKRFYKQGSGKESFGLGLSILEKICKIYNWQIGYNYAEDWHSFQIDFKIQ